MSDIELVEAARAAYVYDEKVCGVVCRDSGFALSEGTPTGRRFLKVRGQRFRRSDVVWLLHHGQLPPGLLTHVDGDLTNDNIGNLGYKSLDGAIAGSGNCWRVRIQYKTRRYFQVGVFSSFYEAEAARNTKYEELSRPARRTDISDLV